MANKRILFHLPYSFGGLRSGSSVRPYKMYQAFLKLGYEVDLIAGDVKTRRIAFEEVCKDWRDYIYSAILNRVHIQCIRFWIIGFIFI